MTDMIRVTVWNEGLHEQELDAARAIYPDATLEEPEHGLSEQVLANTDVLTWWGHMAHDRVGDEIVERVHERVLDGMGLIVLHSGHFSKIFKRLMGTTCNLKWREAEDRERRWVTGNSSNIFRFYSCPDKSCGWEG